MRPLAFLALLAPALAQAQCYQFTGPNATLRIDISVEILQNGPIRSNGSSVTAVTFSSNNTFTASGSTLTSQSAGSGVANIQFLASAAPNLPDQTAFTIAVANADPNAPNSGEHTWVAYLAGTGDLIPARILPSALPAFSLWTGIANSNYIQVTDGAAVTKYPIASVSACAAATGPTTTPTGLTLGNPDNLPGACACADPINPTNGNLFEPFTDYTTAGANPLAFTRFYNSLGGANTFAAELGSNWRTNYDRYLHLSPTTVIAERPDGQQITFNLLSNIWTPDTDVDYKLTGAAGTWTLTGHDDTVETYAAAGASTEALLQTIQTRNGYTQTLQYGDNQLTAITDSYQRALTFAYQNNLQSNLLRSVSTPDGLVITFGYGNGLLTSASYSTSPSTVQTYLYENSALTAALTGIVDENNNRYASWTYDTTGRTLSSTHAGGADLVAVTYNDTDGSRIVTTSLGQQTLYKFSTLQGIAKVTEADRDTAKRTFTYDSNGYLASRTDWLGNLTTYSNDAHGQPITIVEASGTPQARTTTIAYHFTFHLPLTIATAGLTTAFTYDNSGEMLTKTQTDTASGQTRTWVYSWSNYLEIGIRSPRAFTTSYAYDSSGALSSVTNALNQITQITKRLPGGLPLTVVNPNGIATTYTYDPRQRLLSQTVDTPTTLFTTTYVYDPAGSPLSTTLPDGSSLINTYDNAHRVTAIADTLGNSMVYGLDAAGDRTQTQFLDPGGALQRKLVASFDPQGRTLQETGGANQTTAYTYDANGNRIATTDPLNHVTQQTFDALNRLVATTDAAQGVSTTTYDAHDRPLTVTDPNGNTTTYTYNGFGDLIQQSSPATGTTTYRYDANGNVTQRLDARGVEADFTYDALDRPLSVTYPGNPAKSENVAYRYDEPARTFGVGHLTSLTDAAGTLTRDYDERGNLAAESRLHGAAALITTYSYDAASRLSALQYPSNWSINYTRDAMGHIVSALAQSPFGGAPKPLFSGVAYQPFGPANTIAYANGIAETRTFDRDYRLTRIASSVQNETYAYDAAGNLTAEDSQTFAYDVLNRLTSPGYTYDADGNRLTDTSAAPTQDGLVSITAFTYNQSNRLATVSAGPQQLAAYTDDAFGRRIVKVGATTATTIYQYDQSGHLLEEDDAQGSARVLYIYLDDRPVATIQYANSQLVFLHDDRQNAPLLATDINKTVLWSTTYQPFGQIATPPTTITQNLRQPGQEADPDTGLNHTAVHDYAPALGRYLTPHYIYAADNPLRVPHEPPVIFPLAAVPPSVLSK